VIDKRINFRGGGAYQGGSGAPGSAESSGNKSNSNSNSSNNSNNNDGPQHSPHTKSGYTGPTNYGPQQPPQEIIGGKSFNVTPETRDDRERARVKQSILDAPIPNITDKGISFFKDGNLLTNSFMAGDNPLSKPKFNMGNLMFNAALFAINPALAAKYRQAKSLYTGAKYATNLLSDITGKNVSKPFDVVEDLTKKIGIKDKNVIGSFKDSLTSNLTSKPKRKPIINTNASNDGDGINSLENANALQDEYTILLQKLQTGNISDAEQTRYTMLKNMLGL